MANSLKWVNAHGGQVPPHPVPGGYESYGQWLYVARAWHNGYWCPGKIGYHLDGCHTGSNWEEKEYGQYEVLTNPNRVELNWIKSSGGSLPKNAIPVSDNSSLYIGRHGHAGGVTPGKIDTVNQAIYVTYGGKEHRYSDYEALVC